ncbi:MAG: glucan 1,4-alpha-glucosidase [Thermodesulfobacteriota bacterium]
MKRALGKPGLPSNWSTARKQGMGTACGERSKVWFTIANGIITEVYYPTIDTANTKDIQFLVTDGVSFFEEERRDTTSRIEYIDENALAYRVTTTSKSGRYRIIKSIVTDSSGQALIINTTFEPLKENSRILRLFLLFAPHIKNRGSGNNGKVWRVDGRSYLLAWREDIWTALTATLPLKRASVGYVGYSDGWQDISKHYGMTHDFDCAEEGNIALSAEIDISGKKSFTLVLSFGSGEGEVILEGEKSLKRGYRTIEKRYIDGWKRYHSRLEDLRGESFDSGRLYRVSAMILKAHEDKTHRGAVIASPSIPWGEAAGDDASGGYHLVWPRDLCKITSGFLAMGDLKTPGRIIDYLRCTQEADGHWPQNFWLDGKPYWDGIQLDEVAFPILLAWRLKDRGRLRQDLYPMVKRAATFLLQEGPITEQERWEENAGFSPSTLAVEIAALVCAAHWAREKGEERESKYLFEIADYWAARVEEWTFTDCGCIFPDHPEHYQRIAAFAPEELDAGGQVCQLFLPIKNLPEKERDSSRSCAVVDGGFLELVRYGVRGHDDSHVLKTIPVVDRLLRVETPNGPAFHRYNNDGYGEKEDGSPFDGTGVGRAWPLLTGERGMYEIAAGGDGESYIKAMESFANEGGMLPEQVWDTDDIPDRGLFKGRGTGSATPLVWAHSEYIKLLRSQRDRRGCDMIPAVYDRYVGHKTTSNLTAWKINKPIKRVSASHALRIVSHEDGRLLWTADGWQTKKAERLHPTGLGVYYYDFGADILKSGTTLTFTFHYDNDRWEGKDYDVAVVDGD